ncbi:S9 family peptidase [Geobacillus stearothermophilus]|uniref:S9 family peptidase n=1 Tax=Geobacillus stearothermophilus TaxID=1422 RepID=UPI0005194397|nr:S9 family peptidase [Geobacillus stearothermophilus]MED3776660.1 S9 family peptidase [Geobacillus stearothermophilus]MED4333541.1 S9 family peptidase [Geobacillus stearothermophilus]MED4830942.1 S9 family peptidase [Geobacillus stearothermophilus]MED4959844.1 S9 family peptidase [Geobacillus stearothermophilus]MED4980859.1 S9 family peptidase [Geobacillus stearothermophilus]
MNNNEQPTKRRGITAEDLLRLRSVRDPHYAPDGTRAVFVEKSIDEEKQYRSHLWIWAADGSVRQWTFGRWRDMKPRFSPRGEIIAFLSDRSGRTQLWLLPANGGEARQLTFFKNGVRDYVWSPDGTFLITLTTLGDDETIEDREEPEKAEVKRADLKPRVVERLYYKSDASGFLDGKRAVLTRIDVLSGKSEALTGREEEIGSFAISPNGRTLAFVANRNEDPDTTFTRDIVLLDLESKAETNLTNGCGTFASLAWSPDGTKLAAIGHDLAYLGATLHRLYVFEPERGTKRVLTADWDVHLGDAMVGDTHADAKGPGPIWASDGSGLYVTASERGRVNLYFVSLAGPIVPVIEGNFHLYGLAIHPSEQQAIAAISSPTSVGDLYAVSLADGTKTRLTRANEALENEVVFADAEPFTYRSADGLEIQGWIMKPPELDEGEKAPLVVEIHGGPHAMYGFTFFHELQLLASSGYAVLFTNPRGSHGYGQSFVNAVRGDYGGMDYEDIMAGVDAAISKFDFIDKERLGVTGGSYGGFMTNWIVGHTDRFKAAVTQRSISNWLSFSGVSDIGYFFTKWEVGCDVWEDAERLWHHSPLKYVKHMRTPLLILHSERDYRCPIEQAEQLFVALKQLGRETKLVRFPDANHDLSRTGNPALRLERLRHIVDWFDRYLKGASH